MAGPVEPLPGIELVKLIRNHEVRKLYIDLIGKLASAHPNIEAVVSPVEARYMVKGKCLCRVVPYRDLLHIQIGEEPCWEVRVRGGHDYPSALDRILRELLRLLAPPTCG